MGLLIVFRRTLDLYVTGLEVLAFGSPDNGDFPWSFEVGGWRLIVMNFECVPTLVDHFKYRQIVVRVPFDRFFNPVEFIIIRTRSSSLALDLPSRTRVPVILKSFSGLAKAV